MNLIRISSINKIVFFYLLIIIPNILYSNMSLYNDSYKIIMDNTYGTFTILYPDQDDLFPLLDSDNEPFSSFAVLYINKKPYILGSAEGDLLDCNIDSNNISYIWKINGVKVVQKLSLIQYKDEDFIRIRYLFDCPKRDKIDLLIVLDAAENKYLLKDVKKDCSTPSLLKDQDDIILCSGRKFYNVEKINICPDSIIIDNWEDIYDNLNKMCTDPDINCKKELKDTTVGFLWKDVQKNKDDNEIGLIVEKIKTGINPDFIEMTVKEPKIIYPHETELVFMIKNNNITAIDDVVMVIKNTNSPDIKIISPVRNNTGEVRGFSSKEVRARLSSISEMEQVFKLNFKLNFSQKDQVRKKNYHKDFTYDILLKKYTPLIDLNITQTNKTYLFKISKGTNYNFDTGYIVVEDPEGKTVNRISIDPSSKEISWNGMDDKDGSLIKGSYYFYYIEIKEADNLFKTAKKVFTTEIEQVETEKHLILRFPAINFTFGSAALKSYAYPVLKKISDVIRQNLNKNILIEGHTDNVGHSEFNLKLSLDRAGAVKNYFIGMENFPEYQFKIKGWGKEKPVTDNSTEENRSRNRRVEILIEK